MYSLPSFVIVLNSSFTKNLKPVVGKVGHGRFVVVVVVVLAAVVVVPAAVVVVPAVGLLVEVPALVGIVQMVQTKITKSFIWNHKWLYFRTEFSADKSLQLN